MAKNSNTKTFVRITNEDIFNSVESIKTVITNFKTDNKEQHGKIIQRLDKTNGDVKVNKWVARTAMSLVLILFAWFVGYIISNVPK